MQVILHRLDMSILELKDSIRDQRDISVGKIGLTRAGKQLKDPHNATV